MYWALKIFAIGKFWPPDCVYMAFVFWTDPLRHCSNPIFAMLIPHGVATRSNWTETLWRLGEIPCHALDQDYHLFRFIGAKRCNNREAFWKNAGSAILSSALRLRRCDYGTEELRAGCQSYYKWDILRKGLFGSAVGETLALCWVRQPWRLDIGISVLI